MRPILSRLMLLVGWFVVSAVAAAEPTGVMVEMRPVRLERRSYDPARPPRDMPKLTPPEVGTCEFEFSCETDVRGTGRRALPGRSPPSQVNFIKITGRLRVTIWTPVNCPPKILAHEEGHRAICEHYYRPAAELARRIGRGVVGTSLATPITNDAAVQAALKRLQDGVIAEFLRGTMTRCQFAQARFDAITRHSMNPIGEAEAMAQALAEEAAQAGRSDQWPAPTWPLPESAEKAARERQGIEAFKRTFKDNPIMQKLADDPVLTQDWNRERIQHQLIRPWQELEAMGVGVHVGGFGAHNATPHDVALGWLGDLLAAWKAAGWGWAVWNFRGTFGVLDSGRTDVKYESFRGHKLDRKMLELLRAG